MTKFSNKLKKSFFWPIFGPFSQFWGKKIFFSENPATPRKCLDRRTDGRTEERADPIL